LTSAPSNRPPRVTVVVLNWCDAPSTAACLASLRACTYPELSILLVDNGSPDGSGDELRDLFPDVGFLQTGENLGYTGGNNRGIRRALEEGADHVLVLNHDTLVEPGAVGLLVETAEAEERAGAVAPTIVRMNDPARIWYAGGDFDPVRALGVHRNGNGEARAREPDVVLAPSEPYPFRERHVPLLEEVAPVVLVDGQDLFWWGVRTPAAMGRLRRQLTARR
jgi:GT2 family glycosyltransferase